MHWEKENKKKNRIHILVFSYWFPATDYNAEKFIFIHMEWCTNYIVWSTTADRKWFSLQHVYIVCNAQTLSLSLGLLSSLHSPLSLSLLRSHKYKFSLWKRFSLTMCEPLLLVAHVAVLYDMIQFYSKQLFEFLGFNSQYTIFTVNASAYKRGPHHTHTYIFPKIIHILHTLPSNLWDNEHFSIVDGLCTKI